MLFRIGILLGLLALPFTICLGQVAGEVNPATNVALTGGTLTVGIDFDPAASGQSLGSYGATLDWDPAILQFQTSSGGDPPFSSPVVNTGSVGAGLLSFADADPVGASGRVNLLSVTFQVIAPPCVTSALDLEFTSLFATQTFTDLLPSLQIQDGTANVPDFFFDLRVTDPLNTILQWNSISGAVTYDVIRGDVSSLFEDGVFVHLGTVVCLEDDSLDTTTGAGAEPANPDTLVPLPGEAFVYFVRFHDGAANSSYGFTAACSLERVVDAGDCP